MILSLFSGCGGLDRGFELAGFEASLAYDLSADAVRSHEQNRDADHTLAFERDVASLKLADLDDDFGGPFQPIGVIGGPPCQSFSRANSTRYDTDPRSYLVRSFIDLALRVHRHRNPLDFVVMENVPEVADAFGGKLIDRQTEKLEKAGFSVKQHILNARDYGVPQNRNRFFLIAINSKTARPKKWKEPPALDNRPTVADAIRHLPRPVLFERGRTGGKKEVHPNHWCMQPKSKRFFDGSLKEGDWSHRCFKTLAWDKPSITVSYGHREVHVHPEGNRRLSVYEAMLLQGFPSDYELVGTLSAQITQVSDAVPPPLAHAIAKQVLACMTPKRRTQIADAGSEFSQAS